MEKECARGQTLEQLHERRKQVVRLHRQGTQIMQIVTMSGLSYPTVRSTIDRFEAGGWGTIRPAARVRGKDDGRTFNSDQEDTPCSAQPGSVRISVCEAVSEIG